MNNMRESNLFNRMINIGIINCIKRCVFIFFICNPLIALSQTSFTMSQDLGHYYINTAVNGHDNVKILVASRLRGILINENDYKTLFVDSLYKTVKSTYSEFKHSKGKLSIIKIKYGKVLIGDLSYTGNIYVVDSTYSKIGVPIHRLKNEKDSTAYMARLNFGKRTLDFVGQDTIEAIKMHEFKMIESSPEPVIETTLYLTDDNGKSGNIKGNFIFDLGNASPLYLCTKNPSTRSFIKGNGFKVSPATDKSGKNVGRGIYAGYCKVGENAIRHVTIGLTNMSDAIGYIGPSFFKKDYVIIDTKNNIIYYE